MSTQNLNSIIWEAVVTSYNLPSASPVLNGGYNFFRVYLSENGGGVNATSVVVTFEGQKVFAIVFLQCVRAARRGSNAQLSRNVLPGFLFCALWVEQDQTCVEKNRNPIW